MTASPGLLSPRYLYERRYVEPDIELLILDPSLEGTEEEPPCLHRIIRYRPTGIRTPSGYYEYELAEESSIP